MNQPTLPEPSNNVWNLIYSRKRDTKDPSATAFSVFRYVAEKRTYYGYSPLAKRYKTTALHYFGNIRRDAYCTCAFIEVIGLCYNGRRNGGLGTPPRSIPDITARGAPEIDGFGCVRHITKEPYYPCKHTWGGIKSFSHGWKLGLIAGHMEDHGKRCRGGCLWFGCVWPERAIVESSSEKEEWDEEAREKKALEEKTREVATQGRRDETEEEELTKPSNHEENHDGAMNGREVMELGLTR
ncbi:hypothetical protein BDZ85DRAFT_284980 [Elsinoe ampelina]|uniref:Uncharacterized protein n=1 Tax=Elsinoe ampelina TaxID=302913 RepID=A0A6A6G2Y5_9PEZI|nr:hypothetical protein BDZ85DRAFT_284980 [Elsinoe ampelina]